MITRSEPQSSCQDLHHVVVSSVWWWWSGGSIAVSDPLRVNGEAAHSEGWKGLLLPHRQTDRQTRCPLLQMSNWAFTLHISSGSLWIQAHLPRKGSQHISCNCTAAEDLICFVSHSTGVHPVVGLMAGKGNRSKAKIWQLIWTVWLIFYE